MKIPIGTAVIALTIAACTDPSSPARTTPDLEPRFGKALVEDPSATVGLPLDDALLHLKSDGAFSDGVRSLYANGVCGVSARIFLGGSGDMVMLAGNPRFADRKCAFYRRKFTVRYPDGTEVISAGGTMAVDHLQTSTFSIPLGSSANRGFHVSTGGGRCEGVHWGSRAGGDSVIVTRTAANTWHVTTQPYPNDEAVCKNTIGGMIVGTPLGSMPIDLWIVSSRDLP